MKVILFSMMVVFLLMALRFINVYNDLDGAFISTGLAIMTLWLLLIVDKIKENKKLGEDENRR